MLKDFLIALSLANLCFISGWQLLFVQHVSSYPFYHWKVHPGPLFLALIFDVLLLAGLFCGAMVLARRSKNANVLKVARYTFLLALLFPLLYFIPLVREMPLDLVFATLWEEPDLLWRSGDERAKAMKGVVRFLLTGGLIIGGISFFLIHKRRTLAKSAARLLLILSPLVAIWFYQGIALWAKSPPNEVPKRASAAQERTAAAAPHGRRVLWLVFDEWDFRLSFVERPSSLELPELDRLRGEALFAANAHPPGGDTVLSLPALISGKLVSKAHRTSHDELMLNFGEGGAAVPWSREASVFSEARAAGFQTGLAGWYHPYCRILGESLDACSWETAGQLNMRDPETAKLISSSGERGLGTSMLSLALRAMWTIPRVVRRLPSEGRIGRQYQIAEFSNLEEQARRMAADPRLGMIMVHLPIPHPVGIYDRSAHSLSLDPKSGYLDNLALVDHTVGELRRELEKSGLWEQTTVLVTSDHWLRTDRVWRRHRLWRAPVTEKEDESVLRTETDHRVPFILKLTGQREGLTYEPPFNSVLSRELSMAILRGEVSTPSGVADWLDRHRTIGESPYLAGEK